MITEIHHLKNYILARINKNEYFNIAAGNIEFTLFPSFSLIMNDVKVEYKKIAPLFTLIESEQITADISPFSLIGDGILVRSLSFRNGNINIYNTIFIKNGETDNDLSSYLQKIKELSLNNINVNYFDTSRNIKDSLLLNNLAIETGMLNDYIISSELVFNNGYMQLNGKLDNTRNLKDNFKDIEFDMDIALTDFPVYQLTRYFNYINFSSIGKPRLTGRFQIDNNSGQEISLKLNRLLIYNISTDNKTQVSQISLKTKAVYSYRQNFFSFSDLELFIKDTVDAKMEGLISVTKTEVNLNIKIDAGEIFIKPLTDLADSFLKIFNKEKHHGQAERNNISEIYLLSDKVCLLDYEFTDVEFNINYDNDYISVDILQASIYEGDIEGRANIFLRDLKTYNVNIMLYNIDAERLLTNYLDNRYITGRVNSSLNFALKGNSRDALLKDLESSGKITVRNGELFEYANILRPLFSLGKLVNILGPKGKSTEFESLKIDYKIRKERIIINSLNMKGVGLDASGKGEIGFNKKIDMRITVGLGGAAGKIIRVPVIYKGDLFKNWAYIDPIWLGSVYVGMIIIPGPPGAVLGPTVTETVRTWFNIIKDKIRSSD